MLNCQYYQHDGFLAGAASAQAYSLPAGRLVSGMVPHHLVAADMLSGFFTLAAAQEGGYDRVILLSPSHFAQDTIAPIVTAPAAWNTPFGTVAADEDTIHTVLDDTSISASEDAAALERDHGIAGLVPYIAYYLPGVPLTACLIANSTPQTGLDALFTVLKDICLGGRTLLIASIDCSHYLQPTQAAEHDAQTAEAIEAFNYETISHFTDANVDSPECLSLFLRITQWQKASLINLGHATSLDKLPAGTAYPDGITTYFIYAGYTN